MGAMTTSLIGLLIAASSLQAEVLFEGLIQNERLTFEQLVERSISKGQHMDQESERFSEISESLVESAEDRTGNHSSAAGDKRKHETLERDLDLVAAIAEEEVLWRVNFETLLYCLKTKICTENIRSRLGVDAGVVLEAIMEANIEQKIKDAIGTRLQFC